MFNILVAVDRSLESSFALRTACLFGPENKIQPVNVFEAPGRDISFGAGWARKHWERETSKQAQGNIEVLLVAERNQCPNIEQPVVLTGEPIHEMARIFWEESYDLLVAGVPYRGWESLTLSRKFSQVAKKAHKEIPLLLVRQLATIKRVVALTDGSGSAERALGLMVRLSTILPHDMTLIGLSRDGHSGTESEKLHLERGLAILKEKGMDAEGKLASTLGPDGLIQELKSFDLVVKPVLTDERYNYLHDLLEHEIEAVLFYVGVN